LAAFEKKAADGSVVVTDFTSNPHTHRTLVVYVAPTRTQTHRQTRTTPKVTPVTSPCQTAEPAGSRDCAGPVWCVVSMNEFFFFVLW
jgi:hypothetical protein